MLRGRDAERTTIEALLDGARDGISGALILRGEPGIGKSALLGYAADYAAGMRVLRGIGVESEGELPFAGLHLLLRPALDRLGALPEPQREALSAAFGLATGRGGDQFMIGAGVLTLLADLAEDAPLLCLIDDAQWLDRASAEALLFAARRLDRDGVVMIFAVRDYADALASTGIAEIRLPGLDADSAALLLDDQGASLSPVMRDRIVTETRGNPLALRELPAVAGLPGAQLGPMPLTSRVLDAFHHQVRALPPPCQWLLLVAAADDTGALGLLMRAAGITGVEDLQPAETRGLISLSPDQLVFRHPLIRAAVYHGAPLGQRIAAHLALAAAEGADIDRRAWHLAAATTGPDEQVAADLERAADRATARTGHAAAAAAYDRAAQLSADPIAATRRLVRAAEAGTHAGQLEWARVRADRALPNVSDIATQASLIAVRARAEFETGGLRAAHDQLIDGAVMIADHDPERAFWLVVEALHAAWASPTDRQLVADTVDRFDTVGLAPDSPLMAVAWLSRWGTAVMLDRDTATFPPLGPLIAQARAAGAAAGPHGQIEVASRAFMAGRDEESAEIAAALVADARAKGLLTPMPDGLGLLTLAQVLLGRHRDALISGTEALRIGRDSGHSLWVSYASGALAYVAAIQGDEVACRAHAEAAGPDHTAQPGSAAGSRPILLPSTTPAAVSAPG